METLMAQEQSDKNNTKPAGGHGKGLLETILTRNEPVTADTETLYEKARENPEAFADLLTARVNKHLGFNTSRKKS
jgi:hypothetical protein